MHLGLFVIVNETKEYLAYTPSAGLHLKPFSGVDAATNGTWETSNAVSKYPGIVFEIPGADGEIIRLKHGAGMPPKLVAAPPTPFGDDDDTHPYESWAMEAKLDDIIEAKYYCQSPKGKFYLAIKDGTPSITAASDRGAHTQWFLHEAS